MSENLPDNNNNQAAQPDFSAPPVPPVPPAPPAQPDYAAQSAPAAPAYGAAPAKVPGKTLGIVGLILSFFFAIIGMILSIVALVQSRKAGASNVPAIIGIVVGALTTIGWIVIIVIIVGLTSAGVVAVQECLEGATTVTIAGQEQLCSDLGY